MPRMDGELKGAQMEELSADPTPSSRSRFYSDKSDPTSAIPKFFNGTQWLPLKLGEASGAYAVGNSGKAKTIDWANGLVQEVILSAGCVFSFTNWRDGEVHRLLVKQAAVLEDSVNNTEAFSYSFDLPTQTTMGKPFQPRAIFSNNIIQHAWLYASDTGEAQTGWNGPCHSNTGGVTGNRGISYSPDGSQYYVGGTSSPYLAYYNLLRKGQSKLFQTAENLEGTPGAAVGAIVSTAWHPNGRWLFMASATSGYFYGRFLYNTGNAPSTPLAQTSPGGAASHVSIRPNGNHVVVAHAVSPYISIYSCVDLVSLTKLTSPATTPTGTGITAAFCQQGDFVAVQHDTTPFITAYPFSTSGGFGTKIANPTTLPPGTAAIGGRTLAWRPQGDWIVTVSSTTPYIWSAPFDRATGTFGTPFNWAAQPTSGACPKPSGTVNCAAFSPCGSFLLIGLASGGIIMYRWSAAGPDTVTGVTANGTVASTSVVDCVFHPSGDFFSLLLGGSVLQQHFTAPRVTKYHVLLTD